MDEESGREIVNSDAYSEIFDKYEDQDKSRKSSQEANKKKSKPVVPASFGLRSPILLGLVGLLVINVVIYALNMDSRSLENQVATQELQAKYGEQYQQIEPVVEFMESEVNVSGPNDPRFGQLLEKLNEVYEEDEGFLDNKPFRPDDFEFDNGQMTYIETPPDS